MNWFINRAERAGGGDYPQRMIDALKEHIRREEAMASNAFGVAANVPIFGKRGAKIHANGTKQQQ